MDTGEKEVYLTTVTDSVEADILTSMLKASDIPVLRKYRDASGYLNILMGNVVGSIDIYVPLSSHKKAADIVRPYPGRLPDESDYEDDELNLLIEKRKYKYRKFLILLAFLPSLMGLLIYMIYRLFVK